MGMIVAICNQISVAIKYMKRFAGYRIFSYFCNVYNNKRMNGMDASIKLADNYLNMLTSLSDEMKPRIINKLSESLLTKKKSSRIEDCFGSWKDDCSAEEIIAKIHDHRLTGTRNIESLD